MHCLDVFLGETEAIVAKWRSQLLVVRYTCAQACGEDIGLDGGEEGWGEAAGIGQDAIISLYRQ